MLIERANKIIVLERGCLKEQGSHDELLQKGELYSKLYYSQFRENDNSEMIKNG